MGFTCPTTSITTVTLSGNLSFGVTNVPPGTNCTFMFNIPNYYVLLINLSATSGSKEDTVTIFDSNNAPIFESSDNFSSNFPIWIPAGSAKVEVIGVSGSSQFVVSYTYKPLDNYQQIRKMTGEPFSLKSIVDNTFVTVTSSSPEEKVILRPGMKQGEVDPTLQNYFVYDGDNINTANFLGRLSEFKSKIKKSSGQSVSIVSFSDAKSNSYVLGNDASTLQHFEKYTVILTSKGTEKHGVMNDISARESAYTFICTDCSTYSWTQLAFDFVGNIQYGCPTAPITKDAGLTGVLPAGATGQVQVPANTKCVYTFQIPKGFALRVDTTADYEVSMENSINFDNIFISPPAVNVVDYAMNTEVPFEIVSKTGDLAFFTKYSYIDLSNYQQVIIPTGTHLNTTLDSNKYYTVKASNDNDQVNLQYGSRQSSVADLTLSEVFMFDGNDIFNSKYIGRVPSVYEKQSLFYSTSNTVTLINLYGNPSSSLFLGNDASVIKALNNYGVLVMDSDKEYDDWMYLLKGAAVVTDSWYTVICKDCTTFSIDYMLFDTDKDYSNANGFVEVQGMTPSHKLQTMLHYQYSTSNNQSFPQIIPAPMATFHLYNSSFHFKLRPGTLQKDFDTSSGATRYVSSPQLWNPDAKASFEYTFSDFNKYFNFSINLQSLKLENDKDSFNVEVGSADGDNSLDKKYSNTSLENQQIAGVGSYLKLVYAGSKDSTVLLNFEMIDLTATTVSMETTTKESVRSLSLLVLIVMTLVFRL